jgi:hypothetical protein
VTPANAAVVVAAIVRAVVIAKPSGNTIVRFTLAGMGIIQSGAVVPIVTLPLATFHIFRKVTAPFKALSATIECITNEEDFTPLTVPAKALSL